MISTSTIVPTNKTLTTTQNVINMTSQKCIMALVIVLFGYALALSYAVEGKGVHWPRL